MEQFTNANRVLVGISEGKRSLGRPRRRREDNIEMDLREVCCDAANWIDLTQDREPIAGLSNNVNVPPS